MACHKRLMVWRVRVAFGDTGPAQFQKPQAAVEQAGDVIFTGGVNPVGARRRAMAQQTIGADHSLAGVAIELSTTIK